MHARGVWLASSLGMVACFAAPTRADLPELSAYEGTWEYADGREGEQAIERAVARAVDGLPFFAEPFAAQRMRDLTVPFERVTFTVHDGRLLFRADGWGPVGARVGGGPERIPGPDGTPLRLRQYLDDGRLVQIFRHSEGVRHNTLALSGDRRWLWMTVRISSPQLPDDCRYRLRYRRVDASPTQLAER